MCGASALAISPVLYTVRFYKAPLSFTLRIKTWVVVYWAKQKSIFFLQHFSADAAIQIGRYYKKWVMLLNTSMFALNWCTHAGKTEESVFQNMAYRPTVYRTGAISLKKWSFEVHQKRLFQLSLRHFQFRWRPIQLLKRENGTIISSEVNIIGWPKT